MTRTPVARHWRARLPEAADLRRVLVVKWSALGDVALASAVIEDLRRALPDARIDLNTLPRFAGLVEADPRFDRVLAIDARAGLAGMAQWLREVAAARYDAVVDLQSTDRTRLLLAALVLCGRAPRYRVGNHRRWPYNVAPPPQPRDVHALDHLRATLAAAGIEPVTDHPVLHPSSAQRERVASLLASHGIAGGGYALFMPGCQAAGWLKRWGARRFAALALGLRERGVERVLLVGADDEREECAAIAAACPGVVVDLCGRTDILELVPLAEGAACVVGNDTGTAHVAAVARRPMVVVCGPTDPRRVRPAGPAVSALQADLWCRSCYRKDCTHHSCMMLVSPERVLEELARLGAFERRSPAAPAARA